MRNVFLCIFKIIGFLEPHSKQSNKNENDIWNNKNPTWTSAAHTKSDRLAINFLIYDFSNIIILLLCVFVDVDRKKKCWLDMTYRIGHQTSLGMCMMCRREAVIICGFDISTFLFLIGTGTPTSSCSRFFFFW